jgi:hypothetical protein
VKDANAQYRQTYEGEGSQDHDDEEQKHPVLKEEQMKHLKKKREVKQAFKDLEQEGNYDIWYACDGCMKDIKPGKFRFDCKICDNFTFCQKCFRINDTHVHPFKKGKVPLNLEPPENKDDLLSQAYMLCATCKKSLLDKSKRVYNCKTCECFLCKDCKSPHDEHDMIREKQREEEQEDPKEKSKYLEGLLEDYYSLGFEDIIGKDLYTRFKYAKVQKHDFGLENEDILLLNDSELNKLVSLKKYKPYRNDEHTVNLHRIKQIKKKFTNKIEEEKKQLKEVLRHEANLQKEKLLGIKTNAKEKIEEMARKQKVKDHKQDKKERNTKSDDQPATVYKRDRKALYEL